LENPKLPYVSDEYLMNVLLWKYRADEQVSYFVPFHGSWAEPYKSGALSNHRKQWCGPTWHTFHAHKYPEKAKELLEFLKNDCDFDRTEWKSAPLEIIKGSKP
jgi:hypothetical protein